MASLPVFHEFRSDASIECEQEPSNPGPWTVKIKAEPAQSSASFDQIRAPSPMNNPQNGLIIEEGQRAALERERSAPWI